MEPKCCAACGQAFHPRSQAPRQSYCQKPECQRERKRRWQRDKLRSDPDYRENQARAQQAWNGRNPEYWREYRASHQEYVERNRAQQQKRNAVRNGVIAKMDVSNLQPGLPSGVYLLSRVVEPKIAKMDAWMVEITLLSSRETTSAVIAKR